MPLKQKKPLAEIFADNLVRWRKWHKFSQEELAQKIEVHRNTISRWESGDPTISLDNIEKLAELFDKRPVDFFLSELEGVVLERIVRIIKSQIDREILKEKILQEYDVEHTKDGATFIKKGRKKD